MKTLVREFMENVRTLAVPLVVEIGHAQFRDASVDLGDWVFVSVRDARIFTEDYSI